MCLRILEGLVLGTKSGHILYVTTDGKRFQSKESVHGKHGVTEICFFEGNVISAGRNGHIAFWSLGPFFSFTEVFKIPETTLRGEKLYTGDKFHMHWCYLQ